MNKTLKIGIMGGTFNPIHTGHLILAEQSCREFGLDRVIWIPAGRPPHKQKEVLSDADRLKMLELAVEGVPYFEISEYELEKQGLSYTWETLQALKEMYPEDILYFIMGGDSLRDFHTWRCPERILSSARLLVSVRDEMDPEAVKRTAESMMERYGGQIEMIHMPSIDISSSDIRARLARGGSVRFMVPESVWSYIGEHGLYGPGKAAVQPEEMNDGMVPEGCESV